MGMERLTHVWFAFSRARRRLFDVQSLRSFVAAHCEFVVLCRRRDELANSPVAEPYLALFVHMYASYKQRAPPATLVLVLLLRPPFQAFIAPGPCSSPSTVFLELPLPQPKITHLTLNTSRPLASIYTW